MARTSTLLLGDSEMEILTLVWELGEATVSDVQERVLARRKVAYTTVMTMMQNLSKKGYLTYRKEGVTYIYRAAIEPEVVKKDMLGHLMDKVFSGSPANLVQTLVGNESLSEEEKAELRRLISKLDDRST